MGIVRSTLRSAVLLKVLDVARREAAKPQNQAKARELLARVSGRASGHRTTPAATANGRTRWGRPASTTKTARWTAPRRSR